MGQHRYSTPAAEVETQEGYRLDCDSLMSALIKGDAGRWTPQAPRHRSEDVRALTHIWDEVQEALDADFMPEEAYAELNVWYA